MKYTVNIQPWSDVRDEVQRELSRVFRVGIVDIANVRRIRDEFTAALTPVVEELDPRDEYDACQCWHPSARLTALRDALLAYDGVGEFGFGLVEATS